MKNEPVQDVAMEEALCYSKFSTYIARYRMPFVVRSTDHLLLLLAPANMAVRFCNTPFSLLYFCNHPPTSCLAGLCLCLLPTDQCHSSNRPSTCIRDSPLQQVGRGGGRRGFSKRMATERGWSTCGGMRSPVA
jgi:hypothetical protein